MNEIDEALTAILLGAERCLRTTPRVNRTGHFSLELDKGLRTIAYWRRRCTAIDSNSVTAESIELRRERAGISISESARSPLLGLQQAHRDFGRILRDMKSKRQDNLHKLAEAQAETSSHDVASHLKQIKHRELMKNDYEGVRTVINKVTKKRGGRRNYPPTSEEGQHP
jgi:predicted CopG family antitoxin